MDWEEFKDRFRIVCKGARGDYAESVDEVSCVVDKGSVRFRVTARRSRFSPDRVNLSVLRETEPGIPDYVEEKLSEDELEFFKEYLLECLTEDRVEVGDVKVKHVWNSPDLEGLVFLAKTTRDSEILMTVEPDGIRLKVV